MSARVSMANLITRLQSMIGDTNTPLILSDDEAQSFLDAHQYEARYEPLKPLRTIQPGGNVVNLIWVSAWRDWEENAVVTGAQYEELEPSSADYAAGRWTFGSSQNMVLVTGFCYDLAGAAADALESLAARASAEYDFEADGSSFKRSQKAATLKTLAAEYRKKQRAKIIPQVRYDIY